MLTSAQNRLRASFLEWRSRRPYVRVWHDQPLLILPGVLDPVATKVGAWLAEVVEVKPGEHWVDMGCGSGVVGLGLAERGARVTAADIDPECVRNTRVNAELRGLPVEVHHSDLFADLPGHFDGVVYNVPFWPGEPRGRFGLAFFAGPGFEAIHRFVAEAPGHAHRVLVALSEAGASHAEARSALGPHHLLKRERVASEWLGLFELEPRQ